MAQHFKTLSAVFPILIRDIGNEKQILLLRRSNTGYKDGLWDFAASGHVDEGETATQALCRECKEEIGINVTTYEFVYLLHRLGERSYYDIHFLVTDFEGTPTVLEPDKCSEIRWFALNSLPPDMIQIRRDTLEAIMKGLHYGELQEC